MRGCNIRLAMGCPALSRARSPVIQRKCACGGEQEGSGACPECRRRGLVERAMAGAGEPLNAELRARYGARFGQDFSRVRVHAGGAADQAAKALRASAFTVGQNIFLAAGNYQPHTAEGSRLLAHELAHTVQQQGVGPADSASLRLSRPGDAAEREADQAAAGVMAGGVAPLSAQPAGIYRQTDPPNVGPPLQELPKPPICSIGWKDGGWYWKCENIPKIGSTPEIPLDPRDIPKKIKDLLPKSPPSTPPPGGGWTPGGPVSPPGSPTVPLGGEDALDLLRSQCIRYPWICALPQGGPPKKFPPPAPQVGTLWTDEIHFEKDQPGGAGSKVLADNGEAEIQSVLGWLLISDTLQVRLIGEASSEGTDEYNLALGARRVDYIFNRLKKAGYAARVADPLVPDGQESGCKKLDTGKWTCGKSKAAGEALPEDRKVKVTFLRNTIIPPGGYQLQMPRFRPTF